MPDPIPPARYPYQSAPRPARRPPEDAPPSPQSPPADPDVYGGQWGAGDPKKPPGQTPPDRPDKIETPPENN